MSDDDLSRRSLLDLFREEAHTQTRTLSDGLLALEHAPTDGATLESCMRAAHSLKGAARIIGLQEGVDIAGAMEDCFVAAQRGEQPMTAARIDALLRGVDLLLRVGETDAALPVTRAEIDTFIAGLTTQDEPAASLQTPLETPLQTPLQSPPRDTVHDANRMLRVRADTLDRVLGLAGEALVESRKLRPFGATMLRTKRAQREASLALEAFSEQHADQLDETARAALERIRNAFGATHSQLAAHIDELDRFDRRNSQLAQRVYSEALQSKMRPFGDATRNWPRIVRDFARSLGKHVRFSVVGETTQVDRDILEMLDAPIGHLLRNALDHGVESSEQRRALGKPAEATITLEARHSAGKLLISVSDDGAGIDLQALRASIVARGLADADTAARLAGQELLDFLMLPGFSLRDRVTDVSGRGVGLDAVHELVRSVRGSVRIVNDEGRGARFELQLPLTLSVVRSLLVEVGGQPWAFPLAHVRRALSIARTQIDTLEGQQHFSFEGVPVGLVGAHQLFDTEPPAEADAGAHVAVVVIGDVQETYGIAVERFIGERTLAVQPLDPRLGKVRNIAAGALLDDGDAVLIVDVEDMLGSVSRLVRDGQLDKLRRGAAARSNARKHVLVVDDSLTVRELERKLLEKRGYAVTVAVDGMDGWNALRSTRFDLVVTDVDMPRMDGIELVSLIRRDAQLRATPVMIVSYKDRDEDRRRGLEAGADYYLAKGSFHDEALLEAVHDLIGEALS